MDGSVATSSEVSVIGFRPVPTAARRVLLVQSDQETHSHMQQCLQAGCPGQSIAIGIAESLAELHTVALERYEVMICSASLPDGTGLDALAYARGMAPQMAVILSGETSDSQIAAEAIRAGALDFILTSELNLATLHLSLEKCIAHHRIKLENDRLQRELSESFSELTEKNAQLHAMVQKLEEMARTDDLTGLCNRRWLNQMLERHWAEATRFDQPLAFMMIDLDSFKSLNDHMGHQVGDEMLRLAARVVVANCRQVDLAARYGGDEFCIVMPQTQAHEAMRVAERILREFEYCVRQLPAGSPRIGMSIGLSHMDLTRPVNAEELIHHADEAMYAAKHAGKGGVRVRGPEGVQAAA